LTAEWYLKNTTMKTDTPPVATHLMKNPFFDLFQGYAQ
jgi:hypothetical protein